MTGYAPCTWELANTNTKTRKRLSLNIRKRNKVNTLPREMDTPRQRQRPRGRKGQLGTSTYRLCRDVFWNVPALECVGWQPGLYSEFLSIPRPTPTRTTNGERELLARADHGVRKKLVQPNGNLFPSLSHSSQAHELLNRGEHPGKKMKKKTTNNNVNNTNNNNTNKTDNDNNNSRMQQQIQQQQQEQQQQEQQQKAAAKRKKQKC